MNPNPFRESASVLGRYIWAQLAIAAILAVLYALAFGFTHVPLWPAIAVIGGLANLVPRVGSLVPIVLAAAAIGWVHWDTEQFLWAFAGWLAIQILEGFVITPQLLSKPLGLKPWPVFFALLFGSLLFGPIGLLVAVPVLAIAMVFYRWFQRRHRR